MSGDDMNGGGNGRPQLAIRAAGPRDEEGWLPLWRDYLRFYAVEVAPEVTAGTWGRIVDPASPVKARLAVAGGRIVGFAIHHHHPSSWSAADDCYLEDLFVAEDARGLGAGRALIDDLIDLSRKRGWRRLYWHTEETNARARALYDSYAPTDGHVRYRIAVDP